MKSCCVIFLGIIATSLSAHAADVDVTKLPPPSSGKIEFDRDIAPILQKSCLQCHGPERPKGRFRLDDRELALKGGSGGVDIIPGDSAKSPLIHYVAGLVEDMQMPPEGKGDPLTREEIGKLRAWIDQGVEWSTTPKTKFQFSITPSFRYVNVDGDARKFREVEGIREGLSFGVSEFTLVEQVDPNTVFTTDGRIIPEDNDFRWRLSLDRKDLGFVRGGYEQFRRWYDDSGGYYSGPAGSQVFHLNRDLHLDMGRLWTEVGLTLPDRPQVVLGYEYLFKDGDKSTLQWGPAGLLPVTFGRTDAQHVYPAFKEIAERSHIIKLDLSHEINGWYLEDYARVEFYDLETRRENVSLHTLAPTPDRFVVYEEQHEQVQGANTFRIEKQLNDWLFLSGGHHYSQSGADAYFEQSSLNFRYSPVFGEQYVATPIIFDQRTHAFSLATAITPIEHLTISAAVQNEWITQNGVGGGDLRIGNPSLGLLTSDPVSFWANTERHILRENIGLRYSGIPYSVLFIEGGLSHEDISRNDQLSGSAEPFSRETDADLQGREVKAGFNTSPWAFASLSASARRHWKENDYDHKVDLSPHAYPAFIRWRNTVTDQLEGKLTLRPVNWARVALSYQLISTEYNTQTDAIAALTTGSQLFSGEYDANVYSFHLVLTPWRRLYFSSTFSLSDTRSWSFANATASVVPFAGTVYTVLPSATYSLTTNIDLNASCLIARSDYRQDNPTGLTAGIDFERQGYEAGITKRFKRGLRTNLKYGYYEYREGGAGGVNNYRAHAVFATLTMPWPE